MALTPEFIDLQSPHCRAVENPLISFARLYKTQLEMCDQIESIADSLPHRVDRKLCRTLAENMSPVMTALHAIEERVIFPRLMKHGGSDYRTQRIVERLNEEHCFDEGYGEEICELLRMLSEESLPIDMNGVGYAMRGFFESLRRHVHFDLEQVLPLARGLLNDADLRRIADLLTSYQMILNESCAQTRRSIMNHTHLSDG